MEKVVADNLKRLMEYHKHLTPTQAGKYVGVSQQQMDRLLKAQRLRIDTLEKVARGYGLEPYQLLIPGLSPGNPQVLRLLNPAEEALYRALEVARKGGTQ